MLANDDLRGSVSQYRDFLKEKQGEANEVIGRYGSIFDPNNLDALTAEQFHSFLLIKNNKHWDGIHRQSTLLTEDMDLLRRVLGVLLDNSRPLQTRLDEIFPKGKNKMIKGLGRAVATPILHVAYPDEYGVYNTKVEVELKKLGLFPDLPRGVSFAEEYMAVNEQLLTLASELQLSLWELDTLWHLRIIETDGNESPQTTVITDTYDEYQLTHFSLEKHLSDFLYRNWDSTDLAKEYVLFDEGKETAQEYQTEVGRIDLLARDKDHKDWLVIELKRGRSSDEVVGQILRYMGWVQVNLANEGEAVRGMIILGEHDDKIQYALLATQADINLYLYSIDFTLKQID